MNIIVLSIAFAILLFNSAYAFKIGKGKCPEPKYWIKAKLERDMMVGHWFVFVSNDQLADEIFDCRYFRYSLDLEPNNLVLLGEGFNRNDQANKKYVNGIATFGNKLGEWEKSFISLKKCEETTFKSWLIYFNEQNHVAGIFYCSYNEAYDYFTASFDVMARLNNGEPDLELDPTIASEAERITRESFPIYEKIINTRRVSIMDCPRSV